MRFDSRTLAALAAAAALGLAPGAAQAQQPQAPESPQPPQPPQPPAAEDTVTLNFVNADIHAVVKAVSEMTGRNFLIDPRVQGTVNIVAPRPVPRRARRGARAGTRW